MIIKANDIGKTYTISGQQLTAAENINLAVARGEIIAIVGHSGSGKSTLLSLIGGLTKPDSGGVVVDGVDIWALDDNSRSEFRNRKISFIYQFASLIPTLTSLENVLLPTAFGPKNDSGIEKRGLDLLAKVGLTDKAGFYPSQLSGGQQRRVAIARAFITNPQIILADEPTGDLDEETEEEIITFFRDLNREQQTTFVIVTHESQIASRAGRQLLMKNGSIVDEQTTAS